MSKRAEVAALQRYAMRLVTPENVRLHDEFQEGYEQAEKDTIERAIAWLKENVQKYIVNITELYPDAIFRAIVGGKCWDDFRKAMEDEQ